MDTKCIASIGEIVRVRAVKKAAHSVERDARDRGSRVSLCEREPKKRSRRICRRHDNVKESF